MRSTSTDQASVPPTTFVTSVKPRFNQCSAAACEVMVRAMGAALTSAGPGPGPGAMKPLLCETFLRALRYLLTAAQAETHEGGGAGAWGATDATLTVCVDLQCGKIVVLALRGALTSASSASSTSTSTSDPSTGPGIGLGLVFQALQVCRAYCNRQLCFPCMCMYVPLTLTCRWWRCCAATEAVCESWVAWESCRCCAWPCTHTC